MKSHLLFATTLLVFSSTLVSQERASGFFAGPTIAFQTYKNLSGSSTSSARMGYFMGYFTEFTLINNISIQPAIQIVSKGGKTNLANSSQVITRINCIEVPILLNLRPQILDRKIAFGIGPAISYGFVGNRIYQPSGRKEDLNFGSTEGEFKRLEFSVCGNIGLQITNRIGFSFVVNRGLSNTLNSSVSSYGIRNLYFGLRLTYRTVN